MSKPMGRYTRNRAIRLKCYDCSCGNRAEIKNCPVIDCALFPYRMGTENKKGFTIKPKFWDQFFGKDKNDEKET